MANRHERRKNIKLGRAEIVRIDDFINMPSMCAWEGCHCTTSNADNEGWSKMVLYTGKTRTNFLNIDPRRIARDCVLCPEHARYLDEHLLKDIGRPLRHLEGTA
ncbi:hypothetical protein FY036_20940 [Mesorhizobium microcysteis]|uniref:Uncharacterized protein n=1 Tax=Neoaquamicrobium microcysteis TaxID=2682781 RepID=A0A5D4GLZ5_9HYPH|nr:hypothetical protein [Mesorhizobium microcysteis]TYR29348.1 hypothetical protein FY036_20940 [Mesorhizobium microcysteis]